MDDRSLYAGLIRLHVLHHADEGPLYGIGIAEELARHGYKLSAGTLYPILHGMEGKGYLRSRVERRGKSARRMHMRWPLYEIELTYDFLRSDAVNQELQQIMGFFEAMQGQTQPFWLQPPGLSALQNQLVGVGDGVTTSFPMQRTTGGFTEPLAGVAGLAAVRVAGAPLPSGGWTLSAGFEPVLTLSAPPASGAQIAVDGIALWLCRFADDTLDLEQFAYQLFELKSLKLVTVKL